jgi:hypothetical protein
MPAKMTETELHKALDEMEAAAKVAKGDMLEEADPEGGLSTEGTPLRDKIKGDKAKKSAKKKADLAKMMSASDSSSDDSSSDDGSGEDAKKACSDDESSDDDASSPDEAKKSLRARAGGNKEMRKAFDAVPFLENMTEEFSDTVEGLRKGLSSHFDARFDALAKATVSFNGSLAKAITMIGETVDRLSTENAELRAGLKKALDQPDVPQRRSVISKSEIIEPEFGGGGARDPLLDIPVSRVRGWLFQQMSAAPDFVQDVDIIAWEQGGYDPSVLNTDIQKALVHDMGGK